MIPPASPQPPSIAAAPRQERALQFLAGQLQDAPILAVLGREFDVAALESLTGRPRDELLETLDEAVAARIVIEAPGALGRLRFSHALVRDTLYDELSVARRVKLHRDAGAALERRYEGDLEPHHAAAPGQRPVSAARIGARAGERAARRASTNSR
jgi:hypothetical protein